MTPRNVVPKRPAKHGHFYMFSTPDFEGVTIGVTSNPEVRFMYYDFAEGYDLIGIWVFRKMGDALTYEDTVHKRLADGELHGVIIPWDGRWTESMDEQSALIIETELDNLAPRVSWRDRGLYHGVNHVTWIKRHGYMFKR